MGIRKYRSLKYRQNEGIKSPKSMLIISKIGISNYRHAYEFLFSNLMNYSNFLFSFSSYTGSSDQPCLPCLAELH